MLSQDQLDEFDHSGLLRLPGAVAASEAGTMRDGIWTYLKDHQGIERERKGTWPVTTTPLSGFQPLVRSGVFDGIGNAVVSDVIDDLLGRRLWRRERGRVLVTFPQPDIPWIIPTAGWHIDVGSSHPRAVQLFVLLDDLDHQGGGTLVLTGSHHLVNQYVASTGLAPHPRAIKSTLASTYPWLAGLLGKHPESDESDRVRRYMKEGEVIDGVDLRVVELHGSAGDAFIMNSDCFHTGVPNNREIPRMMVTTMATRIEPPKNILA
ncbi:phytanoyl-CoA dioxygenase family protein [Alicyclobacillus fodiniaquatilis]|uniref:Phytanoyl-CoA dioxygenase family protein n=1 Tax=Alicyclobacillus fodiniaquatilis TaxID=1661150 RepID=A0ABW4JFM9_9BACL